MLRRWRNSCQKLHPGWRHMFWDNQAAEELLQERYPWFLDTWRSYPRVVHRGALFFYYLSEYTLSADKSRER